MDFKRNPAAFLTHTDHPPLVCKYVFRGGARVGVHYDRPGAQGVESHPVIDNVGKSATSERVAMQMRARIHPDTGLLVAYSDA